MKKLSLFISVMLLLCNLGVTELQAKVFSKRPILTNDQATVDIVTDATYEHVKSLFMEKGFTFFDSLPFIKTIDMLSHKNLVLQTSIPGMSDTKKATWSFLFETHYPQVFSQGVMKIQVTEIECKSAMCFPSLEFNITGPIHVYEGFTDINSIKTKELKQSGNMMIRVTSTQAMENGMPVKRTQISTQLNIASRNYQPFLAQLVDKGLVEKNINEHKIKAAFLLWAQNALDNFIKE